MIDLDSIADKAAKELRAVTERELVRIIEVLEGRVPNVQEIAKHGRRELCTDGRETYYWKDHMVLQIIPDGTLRWKIKALKTAEGGD